LQCGRTLRFDKTRPKERFATSRRRRRSPQGQNGPEAVLVHPSLSARQSCAAMSTRRRRHLRRYSGTWAQVVDFWRGCAGRQHRGSFLLFACVYQGRLNDARIPLVVGTGCNSTVFRPQAS